MAKIGCFLFVIFYGSSSFSLTVNEVLTKVQSVYSKNTAFEYKSVYQLYKGSSTVVASTYEGYLFKNKTSIYQKIGPTEFIYGTNFFLKINHEEKSVLIDKGQNLVHSIVDLNVALKECSESKIESKDDYYSISLVLKKSSIVECSLIILRVSKKDFHLMQLDLFYAVQQDFSTNSKSTDLHFPHLKIKFENFNLKPKASAKLVEYSSYIQKMNDLLTPIGTCKGYSIIDQRNL
jgi:hypothetical protein